MSRYIDADLLYVDLWYNSEVWKDTDKGVSLEQINNTPTADVQEVKYGHWVMHNGLYFCSVCKETKLYKTPYCANCGAKMDGGENDVR